jgi:predicted TIM-barrel fold metal-dependent hydrolase
MFKLIQAARAERIDLHCYIGHWPFRQLRGNTCAGLLAKMDKYGVDRAVVSNVNGIFYQNTQPANEELFEAVRPHRRFIPFAVINPTYAGWKSDLEVCHRKLGMKGLRLYPQYHDYKLTDAACIEVVKAARDRGLPVAFSLRLIDDRQRSWLDVDRELTLDGIAAVIREVPDAKYIILHSTLGRENANRRADNAAASAFDTLKNADILFDTVRASGCGVVGPNGYDLWQGLKDFGDGRFAFGTAAPFMDYVSPFLRILAMKEADENTKSKIWGGNARRFLNLV